MNGNKKQTTILKFLIWTEFVYRTPSLPFYFQVPEWSVNCNYILIYQVTLARRQLRSLRINLPPVQCPFVYHTWWRLYNVPSYCWTSNRKAVNTNFHSLLFDRPGIEPEYTVLVTDALSIRSLTCCRQSNRINYPTDVVEVLSTSIVGRYLQKKYRITGPIFK